MRFVEMSATEQCPPSRGTGVGGAFPLHRVAGAVARPGSHTTARTGPYTAVHAAPASRRYSPRKLTSP